MPRKEIDRNFPATVAKVVDEFTVVLNRGAEHGVKNRDRFLLYRTEREELTDPETGESLGHLEVVRGTGIITHVQDRMATLRSDRVISKKRVVRRATNPTLHSLSMLGGFVETETSEEPEREDVPFESPKVGDKAKPI